MQNDRGKRMITLAFEKNEKSIYVSHVDILRSINRTIRRAGLQVNYSQGYNRHMIMKLTQPLPFGVMSKEEWVSADIVNDISDEKVMELFNQYCPPYLHAYESYKIYNDPKLAGTIVASDYFISTEKAINYKAEILEIVKDLELSIEKKDGIITKNVSDLIYKVEVNSEGIYIMLAFGNNNLRIDAVANKFNELYALDIDHTNLCRLHQYVKVDNKFLLVSEYLKGLVL
jgi:radical SAM-linked protein